MYIDDNDLKKYFYSKIIFDEKLNNEEEKKFFDFLKRGISKFASQKWTIINFSNLPEVIDEIKSNYKGDINELKKHYGDIFKKITH